MSVIVYSTPTCPYCHKAKEFLVEQGVAFDDFDVSSNLEKQQEMLAKSGQLAVPVLDINGEIIIGFNLEKIKVAIAK